MFPFAVGSVRPKGLLRNCPLKGKNNSFATQPVGIKNRISYASSFNHIWTVTLLGKLN